MPDIDERPIQGAWVLEDNPVDYAKAERLRLRRIYLDIQKTTKERLQEVHMHGLEGAVYWGAFWGELEMGPDRHAKHISDLIAQKFGNKLQCSFQIDFEAHEPHIPNAEAAAWMVAWLKEWRKHRPLKWTSWTLESFQGGWFTPELVDVINRDINLVVVPQFYGGNSGEILMDAHAATLDLAAVGVDLWRIQGFYQHRIPLGWRGMLFTLESIPVNVG